MDEVDVEEVVVEVEVVDGVEVLDDVGEGEVVVEGEVVDEVVVEVDEVDVVGEADVVVGPTGRSLTAGDNPARADVMVGSLPSMPSAQIPIPPNPLDEANWAAS